MQKRALLFYKDYFSEFYSSLNLRVQKKVLWVLEIIQKLERLPTVYFKHIENSEGLYEIRVQLGNNVFRIFCFFDEDNLIVIGHGFQKKTQKTPVKEIEKAITIKNIYYEEKKSDQPR